MGIIVIAGGSGGGRHIKNSRSNKCNQSDLFHGCNVKLNPELFIYFVSFIVIVVMITKCCIRANRSFGFDIRSLGRPFVFIFCGIWTFLKAIAMNFVGFLKGVKMFIKSKLSMKNGKFSDEVKCNRLNEKIEEVNSADESTKPVYDPNTTLISFSSLNTN